MINNGSHTFSKDILTNYQVLSLVPLRHNTMPDIYKTD